MGNIKRECGWENYGNVVESVENFENFRFNLKISL